MHLFDHMGDSISYIFETDQLTEVKKTVGSDLSIKSPMPGIITKVFHVVGDKIKKGQSIIAMEAMKMELVIKAEFDCVIAKINVAEG